MSLPPFNLNVFRNACELFFVRVFECSKLPMYHCAGICFDTVSFQLPETCLLFQMSENASYISAKRTAEVSLNRRAVFCRALTLLEVFHSRPRVVIAENGRSLLFPAGNPRRFVVRGYIIYSEPSYLHDYVKGVGHG